MTSPIICQSALLQRVIMRAANRNANPCPSVPSVASALSEKPRIARMGTDKLRSCAWLDGERGAKMGSAYGLLQAARRHARLAKRERGAGGLALGGFLQELGQFGMIEEAVVRFLKLS
jgi:hypothetical protein